MNAHYRHLPELEYYEQLGRDLDAVVLVKWTNQQYHDDNLRTMYSDAWDPIAGISKANTWRHRNQYYDGLIVSTSLDTDMLTSSHAQMVEHAVQPTDIDLSHGRVAIAAGSRLYVRDTLDHSEEQTVIKNPWFARLHAAELTDNGTVLTVSSAFDHIFEVGMDGEVVWDMDIWATGRNVNRLGHILVKDPEGYERVCENPDIEVLKADAQDTTVANFISDPKVYNGLGLPTNVTPAFVNSVSNYRDNQILATSFRFGEGWIIDKATKNVDVVLEGLKNPHGFTESPDGFMITNTGEEAVHFFDHELRPTKVLDLSTMTDRKQGMERVRWLQNTVYLGDDLYATISSVRQKITLFDAELKRYRDIFIDPSWGVQTMARING